ncbi:MAG: AAA family ATPase, partial [Bacteroidota bacterium]
IIYIVMSLVLRSSRESKGAFKLFHSAEDLDRTHNIILLEEPELGIHPDQLFQLMTFIREVAEENQVILTTHAPQVLDFLEPDELDRIITTSISDRGTLVRKLSDEKKKSIQAYMQEEGFLRDYWIHLDLEDA